LRKVDVVLFSSFGRREVHARDHVIVARRRRVGREDRHLVEDVVNLVYTLVENLANVLGEGCDLQEMGELHLDDESLKQEKHTLDVKHVGLLLVFLLRCLVVDGHL